MLQEYHIYRLLEERIKLLKNQIISGRVANREEQFKCKSRRRQQFPVFQAEASLPTIIEMSPEKPYKQAVMQSVDVTDQSKLIAVYYQIYFRDSIAYD